LHRRLGARDPIGAPSRNVDIVPGDDIDIVHDDVFIVHHLDHDAAPGPGRSFL
jgi:hypothetical protein